MKTEIVLLGTGTSQGVPVICCNCSVCRSSDHRDKRLRSSALIKTGGKTIVIDAGPDFRQQMLRENVTDIDAILLTHEHKDHTGGIDDIRPFNFMNNKRVDIYCERNVAEVIKLDYRYAFKENKYPGVPEMNICEITISPFMIGNVEIIPIRAMHMNLPILGFRVGKFAYITDASYIDAIEITKLKGVELLVVNAVRKKKHYSHFNVDDALDVIATVKPKNAYLTHISHSMGIYNDINKELPQGVELGYDGQKFLLE